MTLKKCDATTEKAIRRALTIYRREEQRISDEILKEFGRRCLFEYKYLEKKK